MIGGPAAPRRTLSYRLDRWLRKLDRKAGKYDRTARIRALLGQHGQRDWGHRLMALVGTHRTGSFEPPRARDLYWREGEQRREDRSAIPGTARERVVTRDGWEAWQGVERGESWRTFDWQDDGGTLRIGYLGDDGRLHDSGLTGRREVAMFRRWFLWDSWIKADWFGLRPWLYYKGLHAAVHRKYPWTCQATPPRGWGGYDHWYCNVRIGVLGTLRRRLDRLTGFASGAPYHPMPHRYHNYRWDGAGHRVDYDPQDVAP